MSPGGLDLVTPTLRLQSGALRDGVNFECATSGGYSRIEGYERFDGHASPSAATFGIIQIDAFVNVPAIGLVVTQATSGATGTIIAVYTGTAPYIIVTQITGTFDTTHTLTVPGPITVGTATTLTTFLSAQDKAIYRAAAADVYRALIAAVPGSGSILGVVGMVFSGVDNVYAFRANVGATAVAIYKKSTSGWTLVPFYNIVSFTLGGTTEPADGTTLTQGGVTATIKRVMSQSGIWASNTAAGQFVITNPAGGNFAAGAATIGAINVTLSGAETAITLAIGGRFEFVKCNFSGQAVTRRIYGCDGVNKCFEFDGDTLAPITTGLTNDAPSHIAFHKNYLWVSYASSVLHCGVGTPFRWSSTDGGGEIATGDTVNGMITLPGDQTSAALAVLLHGNTAILYGTDPDTFNYVALNTGVGARAYSIQNLFDTFVLDDFGVITLRTTLNYGNFAATTLTRNILPFIIQERSLFVASLTNRLKSQYRLFFSDGYGLYCSVVNQQYLGSIPVLFPNPVLCGDEVDLVNGDMASYFGSSNGFVYQLDKGTSFDGSDINAYILPAWDAIRSPLVEKRFRAVMLEVQGEGYATINYGYALDYGNTQTEQPSPVPVNLSLNAIERWDSFTWDEFVWDGTNLIPSYLDATGTGVNIQPAITSGTNYCSAYTVDSIIHSYTPRRGLRP